MNKKIKKGLNSLVFAAAALPASYAIAVETRPNILILMLDDLGYADVGFMEHAQADIYTPNIDELANDGVVFTSSYAAHPYCGPSRAGLMTGRYQHDIGAQFNLHGYSDEGVQTDETFFSTLIQNAGYNTGLIGKWHLGEELEYQPNNRGFDYFYGMLGGGHVYNTNDFIRVAGYNPNNTGIWDYRIPLRENFGYAPETGYENNLYITDMLTDAGVAFIERSENNDEQPFFLMMSYTAPHTPEEAKASDRVALRNILGNNASSNTNRHEYASMVYGVDRGIEKIVETLRATGEFDNTLIVFTSDNGGRLDNANASNTPLRGGKTSVFEGGIRVPMFMHWPNGQLPQGEYEHVVSSLDLYPTLVNLAEGTVPADKELDGLDIIDNVRSSTNARLSEPLYFMMHTPNQNGGLNYSSVVLNNWKWFTSGNGNWQLFNLDTDIGEQRAISNNSAQTHMLDSIYRWTWTHITPEFFDSPSYGWEAAWDRNNMPNFGRTFPNRYNANDYNGSTPTPSPTPTPVTGGNVVQNAGFEDAAFGEWSASYGNTSRVNNNARTGNSAGLVNGNGALQQYISVQPNTTYTLSAWVKVGGANQNAYLGVRDYAGAELSNRVTSTGYTLQTINFTTGNNDSSARIYLWNGDANQSAYLDDVVVTAADGSTPTSTPTPTPTPDVSPSPTPSPTPTPEVTPSPDPIEDCSANWISVTGVAMNSSDMTLQVGEQVSLDYSIFPSCASQQQITLNSSSWATVLPNNSGTITARRAGTVTITVRTKDGGYSDSITVTVE